MPRFKSMSKLLVSMLTLLAISGLTQHCKARRTQNTAQAKELAGTPSANTEAECTPDAATTCPEPAEIIEPPADQFKFSEKCFETIAECDAECTPPSTGMAINSTAKCKKLGVDEPLACYCSLGT